MIKYLPLFLLLVLTCSTETKAQETQTLFGTDISHGGFGAPVFGVTSVNGQVVYLRGTRGAWVMNFTDEHALNLGFGTYRTRNNFDPEEWSPNINEPEMRTNYSGLELEYVNRSSRLFHYSLQTLIGSGRVRYSDPDPELEKTSDTYFALQPGINMSLNITTWFRLTGGLYYRYANGANLEGTDDAGVSGASSFVTLKFGSF